MLRRPGPVSAKAAPPADHLVNILLPRAEAGAGPAPYPLPDSLGLGAAGGTEVVVAGDVPARKVTGRRGASDFDGAPATRRDFRQLQSSVFPQGPSLPDSSVPRGKYHVIKSL